MSGRSAARDMSAMSSMRAWGIGPTVGMNSSVVPGCRRMAPARAMNSSKAAKRDGTGWLSPSTCPSPSEEENPRAPPATESSTSVTIRASSSGVAARAVAAAPITARRTAECPTRKPALTERPVSNRSR